MGRKVRAPQDNVAGNARPPVVLLTQNYTQGRIIPCPVLNFVNTRFAYKFGLGLGIIFLRSFIWKNESHRDEYRFIAYGHKGFQARLPAALLLSHSNYRDVKRGNLYVVQDQIGPAIGMVRSSVKQGG